jgi:pyruvate dehydrogenase E1 component alpha subunit
MYRRMLRIRRFDAAVGKLLDRGFVIGAAHASEGQEAVCVGACMALDERDYMAGNHRSHGHPIAKGAKLAPLMAEMLGRRTGVCMGFGGSMHLADFSVGSIGEAAIVGSSLPVAVGAALAASTLGDGRVALVFFGDGATNGGTFHESLNMAALWRLPVIFLCENNLYAVSTPIEKASAVANIADRAPAYGLTGVIVDGQDVLEVHAAVKSAVDLARSGGGPTLIEAKTYRFGEHSLRIGRIGGVRDEAEVTKWRERDPIDLFEKLLVDGEIATDDDLKAIREHVAAEVEDAVTFAMDSPDATMDDLVAVSFATRSDLSPYARGVLL